MATPEQVSELCATNSRLQNLTTLLSKGEDLMQFFVISPNFAASPEVVALADLITEYQTKINSGFMGTMEQQRVIAEQAIENISIEGYIPGGPIG